MINIALKVTKAFKYVSQVDSKGSPPSTFNGRCSPPKEVHVRLLESAVLPTSGHEPLCPLLVDQIGFIPSVFIDFSKKFQPPRLLLTPMFIDLNTYFPSTFLGFKGYVKFGSGLYSPDLSKCYFLQIHTKIYSKVPIFYFKRPRRPPL